MGLVKYQSGLPLNLNSFFDDFFVKDGPFAESAFKTPSANVKENEKDFSIELQAPGFDKGDFELAIEKNLLTIMAGHKEERKVDDAKYTLREFSTSKFKRSFRLPDNTDADGISASYTNGILQVVIPKKEAEKTVKTITVS